MGTFLNPVNLRGFFTTQIWLQGQTLREIEKRLGFDSGRFSQGVWFTTAVRLPQPEEFEFAGYSQVAGHHTKEIYGDINSSLNKQENAILNQKRLNVIRNEWSLYGNKRLIKVIPMIGHSLMMGDNYQYPPGSGIPQWKIVAPIGIPWKGISFVDNYPNGQFIPDEGYTPIRYK